MNSIAQIVEAVKNGEALENLIPVGASLAHWEALLNNYKPNATAKRKPAKRTGSGKTTRKPSTGKSQRSRKAAMDSVVSRATLTLVERVNRKDAIPFDGSGPGDDTEGTEAALGLQSPF